MVLYRYTNGGIDLSFDAASKLDELLRLCFCCLIIYFHRFGVLNLGGEAGQMYTLKKGILMILPV